MNALQVAFLTGQSDPGGCALSPVQQAFLERLPLAGVTRVSNNFPYAADTRPYRPVSLVAASWHNTRQYLASRRAGFAEAFGPSVCRLLDRADHTVLLAGSCGLELLANLSLPAERLATVSVFAYGPVARRRPACACVVVCGDRDWLSRMAMPHADHVVQCGHMDYLESAEVQHLCAEFVGRTAQGIIGAVR